MASTDPTFTAARAPPSPQRPSSLLTLSHSTRPARRKTRLPWWTAIPASSSYGRVVGWSDLPTAGNELHHFGWNACSSARCHEGHDGHAAERRYLVVPGIRSSTTYVLDTKTEPRNPVLAHTIEADELAAKAGYSRLAHRALRAGRHLHVVVGWRERRRPWRCRVARSRHVRGDRAVGAGPRTSILRLRRVVASTPRHGRHLGMGHAVDDRGRGRIPRTCLAESSGTT